MPRVLVLCTGNSARSQIAEGFLRAWGAEAFSAGTHPAPRVNPFATAAMAEIGIDISAHTPKSVERFLRQPFDYVITVCGEADAVCPAFTGAVGRRVHIGFPDPAAVAGSDADRLIAFRTVRDAIAARLREYYEKEIAP
ncbi:MAG: arsenate reductase ArsC [Bryobacteraceae bacterium]